jgi:hypothetical protein
MVAPFKEAFCRYACCTPGSYAREVLYRCLHPNALPVAGIINWIEPAAMFEFLREIGETTSKDSFLEVLSEYQYRLKLRGGFLANRLNIRLAVHLLAKLHDEVRRAENEWILKN